MGRGHKEWFLGLKDPSDGLEGIDAQVADADVGPGEGDILHQPGERGGVVEEVDVPHGIVGDPSSLTSFLGGQHDLPPSHGVVVVDVGERGPEVVVYAAQEVHDGHDVGAWAGQDVDRVVFERRVDDAEDVGGGGCRGSRRLVRGEGGQCGEQRRVPKVECDCGLRGLSEGCTDEEGRRDDWERDGGQSGCAWTRIRHWRRPWGVSFLDDGLDVLDVLCVDRIATRILRELLD